jgi:CHAT domain-containing protein/Tfp pilus assembly protein PilF
MASPPGSQAPTTQNGEEVTTLEFGKLIERELAGGQKHIYQIVLSQGQFMKVEISDSGVDVSLLFQLPNGEAGQDWTAFRRQEIKTVSWVAETAGVYRLRISALPKAPPAKYQVRLAELHPATENERALQEARGLFQEHRRLQDQGKWFEARPLILRCLEIRERVLGPDDLLVATTLGFVSNSYTHTGDYALAAPAELRALRIKEKVLGPDHPDVVDELFGLSVSYRDRGDSLKEEEMLRKAWSVVERTQGTETSFAAAILQNLGRLEYGKGNYASAEEYFRRGRAVGEQLFGPDHYHLASSYSFSGRAAYDAGDYARAEGTFQRALTLAERGLGAEHPSVTPYRNDMAMLYCTTGEYAKGEALYERSLSIHEQRSSMSYPPAKAALYGMARCLAAEGKWADAITFQARASALEEHFTSVNLTVGSEREKQAFVAEWSLRPSRIISLGTHVAHDDPTALHLAITTILQNKGRVQDAVSNNLTVLRQRFAPEDNRILEQLDDLNSQLAKLVLGGTQKLQAAERLQQIKAVEDKREQLEEEMNHRTAGFYQGSKTVTLAAVQAAIPEKAALVEFAVYRPFDPKAPDNPKAYGDPHYVVYVVHHQGEVQWRELGAEGAIDQAIDSWRQALRDPQRNDVQQLARRVDAQIMRPVRALTGDATHLLISPDGELNLIPFEALVDEQHRYLIERYSVSYLTTGRDLLRMQVARESKSRPVVVADPLFGEPGAIPVPGGGAARMKPVSNVIRQRNITSGEDLSGVYFAPLKGTAQEARVIQSLFPEAQILSGSQATKEALQRLLAPRILHIATHGFFLQDSRMPPAGKPGAVGNRNARSGMRIEEPLLRSGLALSGANRNQGSNEEGILTALEASNLNLWGTKLVTLSACETAVGEVKDGEGVYGLRRSFFLAGTETLVMSLWSVSDRFTQETMTAYYTGLKRGLGRGEALRQAELAMLKRKDRQHPYYWASFIQAGEWADLDGQR